MRTNSVLAWLVVLLSFGPYIASHTAASSPNGLTQVDEAIFAGIEKRYAGAGFSARFEQMSTLKAMDITDTAKGTIIVKRPVKMRWVYEKPEKQEIVSDGKRLWIYRPQDNQVMVGTAPDYFGDGRGAGFLSDLTSLRKQFDIFREKDTPDGQYRLKLIPHRQNQDITTISLVIDKETFHVAEVITYNIYEDETRIKLIDIFFSDNIDDEQFIFTAPPGVDVVTFD